MGVQGTSLSKAGPRASPVKGAAPMPVTEDQQTAVISADSVKLLFEKQQGLIQYFFDAVDYEPIARLCRTIRSCTGSVVMSGVGKSGFIAQKICQTLVSTGTRSVFLSPTDALHGDIGIVGADDLLVMFSKSGGTEELLRLVPYVRAKGARLVAVVNVAGSRLEAACDDSVLLPLERELCPFDLAPVTSTALQMLFGDTVAIALMRARALTRDEYAMNHPAGRIGRRLMLRVEHVMKKGSEVPTVSPSSTVAEALVELSAKGCGAVLVVQPQTQSFLGVFTDGDLRRALQRAGAGSGALLEAPISSVMTASARTTRPSLKAVEAMQEMEIDPKVSVLPVLEDGRLVGVVTLHGLISAGI